MPKIKKIERPGGRILWYNKKKGKVVDDYQPDFGCAKDLITCKKVALMRLESKPRPYAYDLYMADIVKKFG